MPALCRAVFDHLAQLGHDARHLVSQEGSPRAAGQRNAISMVIDREISPAMEAARFRLLMSAFSQGLIGVHQTPRLQRIGHFRRDGNIDA